MISIYLLPDYDNILTGQGGYKKIVFHRMCLDRIPTNLTHTVRHYRFVLCCFLWGSYSEIPNN